MLDKDGGRLQVGEDRYWIKAKSDTGCWILDTGYWKKTLLGAGCKFFRRGGVNPHPPQG
jgi:hypothetical protein